MIFPIKEYVCRRFPPVQAYVVDLCRAVSGEERVAHINVFPILRACYYGGPYLMGTKFVSKNR